MARRKSKKPRPEDTSIFLDSSVPQPRKTMNSNSSPALLFIIFAVGSSIMASFCVQQQHSLDQLTESFTTTQKTMANLQQVMEVTRAQTDSGLGVVERIFALEETQNQAQERARVALDTLEEMKNPDLYSQLSALHDEMDTQLAEINQVTLSVTTLQALFKNQSEELEAVKESVAAGLRCSSKPAENVTGLANAVASAYSRADEHVASVEALNGQLDGHALELNELKESVHLHNGALSRNNQELAAMRELVEAKRAMRAQALEEMLSSVLKTLDEQFFTSQSLHSSVLAQLQTFHTQLANAPSQSMKLQSDEEGPGEEEFNSTTMQNATGMLEHLSDVEAKTEQEDNEDEAEEETKEEETLQREPPLERGMEGDVTEQEEKDIFAKEDNDEHNDEEITGQSEEQEVAGETAEEEVFEETVDSYVLDKSLEEEVSQEVVESWETVVEDSAELNGDVFMDEDEDK